MSKNRYNFKRNKWSGRKQIIIKAIVFIFCVILGMLLYPLIAE